LEEKSPLDQGFVRGCSSPFLVLWWTSKQLHQHRYTIYLPIILHFVCVQYNGDEMVTMSACCVRVVSLWKKEKSMYIFKIVYIYNLIYLCAVFNHLFSQKPLKKTLSHKKASPFSLKSYQNGENSMADNSTKSDPNGKVSIHLGSL
jgi:hypothetical protein